MVTPERKPKRRSELLRNLIDFTFGFENTRGEVLDSWILYVDNFSFPPQEFYSALDNEMTARNIPGMEICRQEFHQGGLLSEKRIYLRLFRERLALYTCAAPFGTGYFFSFRAVYVPALMRLWHIVASIAFIGLIGGSLVLLLGLQFAILAFVTLPFAIAGVFREATAAGVGDMDAFFLKIPVLSAVYESWFREDTFYRIDTRSLYLQQIPGIIRGLAEEITAAKGVKLLEDDVPTPILHALSKAPHHY